MKPQYAKTFIKTFPLLYPKNTEFYCEDGHKQMLWILSQRLNRIIVQDKYSMNRGYKHRVPTPNILEHNGELIYFIPDATASMCIVISQELLKYSKKKPSKAR